MLADESIEGLTPLLAAMSRRGTAIRLVEQMLEVDQRQIEVEGTPEQLRRDPTIRRRLIEIEVGVPADDGRSV